MNSVEAAALESNQNACIWNELDNWTEPSACDGFDK